MASSMLAPSIRKSNLVNSSKHRYGHSGFVEDLGPITAHWPADNLKSLVKIIAIYSARNRSMEQRNDGLSFMKFDHFLQWT